MITQQEITNEIAQLRNRHAANPKAPEAKSAAKRVSFLQQCLFYMQSNPSEEYLKIQLESLEKRLAGIKEKYFTWLQNTPGAKQLANPKSRYAEETGSNKITNQVETLNFILQIK